MADSDKSLGKQGGDALKETGRAAAGVAKLAAKIAKKDYIGAAKELLENPTLLLSILAIALIPVILLIQLPTMLLNTGAAVTEGQEYTAIYQDESDRVKTYFQQYYNAACSQANSAGEAAKSGYDPDQYEIEVKIESLYPDGFNFLAAECNEVMAIHGVCSQYQNDSEYNDITSDGFDTIDEQDGEAADNPYDRKFFKQVKRYAKTCYIVGEPVFVQTGTKPVERDKFDEYGNPIIDPETGAHEKESVTIILGEMRVPITKTSERFWQSEIDAAKAQAWADCVAEGNYLKKTQDDIYARVDAEIADMWDTLNKEFGAAHALYNAAMSKIILEFIANSPQYAEWSTKTFNGTSLPFSSYDITSGYGSRILYGKKNDHRGLDFGEPKGTPINSVADGVVVYTNNSFVVEGDKSAGYGNCVVVYHGKINGQDVFTVYGHCLAVNVTAGQTVTKGQQIATVGSTGNSTGPHLHFEINLVTNGGVMADNPLAWLS